MDTALYHPSAGYYTANINPIGKNGDYYTSSSLGPLFGTMMARQLLEILIQMDAHTIVEIGAGRGLLARDILDELEKQGHHSRYFIVEKSPLLLTTQKSVLSSYENVSWFNHVSGLPPIEGVIFSNELIDAMPVHAVQMTEEGLKEIFIDWKNGFTETLTPPSDPAIEDYFQSLDVELSPDFRTEVNLEALIWLEAVAEKLSRGFLITIDYGYPSHELYQPYRRNGTLMAYERHQAHNTIYENVGYRDLTSHVNFSALAKWGEKYGLNVTGFTDQSHFLMSLGLLELLHEQATSKEVVMRLDAKTLLLPGGMGEIFKVLVQHKGLPPFPLRGLTFLPKRKSCQL